MSDIEELADRLRDLKYDYDSMSTSLEDAIDDIADEVEKLQSENERLRSCLSDSAENSKQIMHEAHVQAEENKKLRKLCKDIYEFVYECQLGCEQYLATFDAERATYDESVCNDCWMERRMRELGVEV